MKLQFALIDAFAEKPLTGNPCAVVLGADSLDDATMFAITKEMNQSETAFLLKPKTGDLRARYFTPDGEIPLAGHPTLATIHAALEAGILHRKEKKDSYSLELNEGPITVEVETKDERNFIRMIQRKPVFGEIHDPKIVLPLFGLSLDDLKPDCKIQTVSTGTPQLMTPIRSHDSLRKIDIRLADYMAYRQSSSFFSPHLFCTQGISADAQTFARHLGTMEDAFTGSATGGMAAYLWKYQLISKPVFIAEQGHWMGRPGRAWVEVKGPHDNIETVSIAGTTVTVVRGYLDL